MLEPIVDEVTTRGIVHDSTRPHRPYNQGMFARRTRLSLAIAIGSTLALTTVAAVALCMP